MRKTSTPNETRISFLVDVTKKKKKITNERPYR